MAALDPNSALQNIPPKPPIAHQAEPGIFEGGRLVVLKEEVADPGECVTLNQRCCNQPPALGGHSGNQQDGGNARACEMQPPAGRVGMFTEIKRIEVAESAK